MDTFGKLKELIQPLLDELQIELVELQYNKGKRTTVRLFIWEEGGISLDRCTATSRQIADLLERKDIIPGKYHLEVSSPGLDRPLKDKRDFERQLGRTAKVVLQNGEKTRQFKGKIEGVDDAAVTFKLKKGAEKALFDEIVSAKVVVEF